MKILLVHNTYKTENPSGEDLVVRREAKLLKTAGFELKEYIIHNDSIANFSKIEKLLLPLQLIWSPKHARELKKAIEHFQPDVIHVHNVYYQISPIVFWVAAKCGIPVVQTLHNYRHLCANGLFLREGKPCEKCVETKNPFWALRYKCFRSSFAATAPLVVFQLIHNILGTWKKPTRYFALTEFSKSCYLRGGFAEKQFRIKPNYYPDSSLQPSFSNKGYALFLGRLTKEKGAETLSKAWKTLSSSNQYSLKLIGGGELLTPLQAEYSSDTVEFLGHMNHEQVIEALKGAKYLIIPSEWYEGFPLVILEAYACGKPVLAADIGSLSEVVLEGQTGFHFEPGNIESLMEKIHLMENSDLSAMGKNAHQLFLEKYTAEKNVAMFEKLYMECIEEIRSTRGKSK